MRPDLQPSTENGRIVLVGFGGFGSEVFEYLAEAGPAELCQIGGDEVARRMAFIDDAQRRNIDLPFGLIDAGTVQAFVAGVDDQVIITIGKPSFRAKLWQRFNSQKTKFITFVHKTAVVASSAKIGQGVIIGPMAVVNAGARIGDNVLINCYASVGHGGVVGDHSVLSPYATVLGDARIGQECWLGTRASVFPQVVVGNRCTIDSHSFAKMNVPDDHIVRCRSDYQVLRDRLIDSERKM